MKKQTVYLLKRLFTVLILVGFLLAEVTPISVVRANDIDGSESGEPIDGTGGDDVIDAGGGDDVVDGAAGDDVINGDTMADGVTESSSPGDDTLTGGEGDDEINGGAGEDVISGEEGDDTLTGGTGEDTLDGGAGTDAVVEVMTEGTQTETSGFAPPPETPASEIPVVGTETECLLGNCDSPSVGTTRKQTVVELNGSAVPDEFTGITTETTATDMVLTDTSLTTDSNVATSGGTTETSEQSYKTTVTYQTYGCTKWGFLSCKEYGWKTTPFTIPLISYKDVLTYTSEPTAVPDSTVSVTDDLSNIEEASLTGNSVDNTLDASAFTLGSVWLYGLNGDDTLIGGSQDDHLSGGKGDDTLDRKSVV